MGHFAAYTAPPKLNPTVAVPLLTMALVVQGSLHEDVGALCNELVLG